MRACVSTERTQTVDRNVTSVEQREGGGGSFSFSFSAAAAAAAADDLHSLRPRAIYTTRTNEKEKLNLQA